VTQRRCPYLEQVLHHKTGPIHRYRADCHVDHRTHTLLFLRHPAPPCLTNFEGCSFYQHERAVEDQQITRYTD